MTPKNVYNLFAHCHRLDYRTVHELRVDLVNAVRNASMWKTEFDLPTREYACASYLLAMTNNNYVRASACMLMTGPWKQIVEHGSALLCPSMFNRNTPVSQEATDRYYSIAIKVLRDVILSQLDTWPDEKIFACFERTLTAAELRCKVRRVLEEGSRTGIWRALGA